MREDYGKTVDYKYIPLDIAFNRAYGKRDDKQNILADFVELRTIIENERSNYFDFAYLKNIITTK